MNEIQMSALITLSSLVLAMRLFAALKNDQGGVEG
jgi:hypothetical protein